MMNFPLTGREIALSLWIRQQAKLQGHIGTLNSQDGYSRGQGGVNHSQCDAPQSSSCKFRVIVICYITNITKIYCQ